MRHGPYPQHLVLCVVMGLFDVSSYVVVVVVVVVVGHLLLCVLSG